MELVPLTEDIWIGVGEPWWEGREREKERREGQLGHASPLLRRAFHESQTDRKIRGCDCCKLRRCGDCMTFPEKDLEGALDLGAEHNVGWRRR